MSYKEASGFILIIWTYCYLQIAYTVDIGRFKGYISLSIEIYRQTQLWSQRRIILATSQKASYSICLLFKNKRICQNKLLMITYYTLIHQKYQENCIIIFMKCNGVLF